MVKGDKSKPLKMKKKIVFLSLLFIGAISHAQTTTFGIKAGANTNTFMLESNGTGSDTKYYLKKAGFHVGGVADIAFSSNFSVQPQLLLVSKGGKLEQSGSMADFNFLTIDLPINLLYNYNGFFIGGGPNLSYGVSGKGDNGTDEFDLYDEDEPVIGGVFKRFEFGLNGTMGFRFPNGLTLSSNISCGLSDIVEEDDSMTGTLKSNNNYIGFSIGYMFGKK